MDVETRTLVYPKDLLDPKDWLNFVQMPAFEASWAKLNLNDEDLRALEIVIMGDPQRAPVIAGTGGVRKLRFAAEDWNTGKRGGIRVCYVYFDVVGVVVLLVAFAKASQADLTPAQKKKIRTLVAEIEKYLRERTQ